MVIVLIFGVTFQIVNIKSKINSNNLIPEQIKKNESLESKPNKEAKIALYGSPKVSNEKSNPIVEEFSKGLNFEYLESRSESFNAFHSRVKKFIEK